MRAGKHVYTRLSASSHHLLQASERMRLQRISKNLTTQNTIHASLTNLLRIFSRLGHAWLLPARGRAAGAWPKLVLALKQFVITLQRALNMNLPFSIAKKKKDNYKRAKIILFEKYPFLSNCEVSHPSNLKKTVTIRIAQDLPGFLLEGEVIA
jgi:hypothetical protein